MFVSVARQSVNDTPSFVFKGGIPEPVSAKAVYVFDVTTGTPIYSKNKDTPLPIASVTKLFSSALFYSKATMTQKVAITYSDVQTSGRAGRLQVGQMYKNNTLLFPALLESSNDAAVTMQRVFSGELVSDMNEFVQSNGYSKTKFVDTSGLGDGNVSTAYELAHASLDVYRQYPYIFDITQLKTYLNGINAWMNNNPFIRDKGYKGGKHGYTPVANGTAVAFFEEDIEGDSRLFGYVLLGSHALQTDMNILRSFVQSHTQYK